MLMLKVGRLEIMRRILLMVALSLFSILSVTAADHVFILSGQSNMARFHEDRTFAPALYEALGKDNVVIVKEAEGGTPIRNWLEEFRDAEGKIVPKGKKGRDMYADLMVKVNAAVPDPNTAKTITFVWMQGERDAKEGYGSLYARSLRELFRRLEKDLNRTDIHFVIGRLNEYSDSEYSDWNLVRLAQVEVAEREGRAVWVDTDGMDESPADLHHTDAGYDEMGRRFAAAALGLIERRERNVFQGNGIKVGEMSADSAIIWTRLTDSTAPHWDGREWLDPSDNIKGPAATYNGMDQMPADAHLAEMAGSLPGLPGEVKLTWQIKGQLDSKNSTDWLAVDPDHNFIRQIELDNLTPGKDYSIVVESRNLAGKTGQAIEGRFRTAPAADDAADVGFVLVTGHRWPSRDAGNDGLLMYPKMLALAPDFFIHTGDVVYYDKGSPMACSVPLARMHWNRWYGTGNLRDFHNQMASYFMKDDHDITVNDSYPGLNYGVLTWPEGIALFEENTPAPRESIPYRSFRWGKHFQIWLLEGREFRSEGNGGSGMSKGHVYGKDQLDWLTESLKESDATFKALISPTPMLGSHMPDHYSEEFQRLHKIIADNEMVALVGDRHWQYISRHPELGFWEFDPGPGSDAHAVKPRNLGGKPIYSLLNWEQGGFLHGKVAVEDGVPVLTLSHYVVDGSLLNRVQFKAGETLRETGADEK